MRRSHIHERRAYVRVFLGIGPKTQGRKNSNSRKNSQKTQGFLARKLQKPEIFGQIHVKNSNFSQKLAILGENFENFLKTRGFFKNSCPKSVKNSRNRKLHLPLLPKKRLKKPWFMYTKTVEKLTVTLEINPPPCSTERCAQRALGRAYMAIVGVHRRWLAVKGIKAS